MDNYKDRENRETIAKALGKSRISDKLCTKLELMDKGIDMNEVLTIVDGGVTPDAKANLKRTWGRWSLKRPDMQKLANKGLRSILKGKPVEGTDSNGKLHVSPVTPGHIIAVATMIADRVEPAVKHISSEHKEQLVSFVHVDLSSYERAMVHAPELKGTLSNNIAELQE